MECAFRIARQRAVFFHFRSIDGPHAHDGGPREKDQSESADDDRIDAALGEYYAANQRSIPPLLYAEMIVQSGIQFDVFGVQLRFGIPRDGCWQRDLFQISCLLDRFAALGQTGDDQRNAGAQRRGGGRRRGHVAETLDRDPAGTMDGGGDGHCVVEAVRRSDLLAGFDGCDGQGRFDSTRGFGECGFVAEAGDQDLDFHCAERY